MVKTFSIGSRTIGGTNPTYFIADVAANHDGDIERAKSLIVLAKGAGADCVKFQHFKAKTIVSDYGFRNIPDEYMSHQATWQKSVYDVYDDASVPLDWTPILKTQCDKVGIEFMTTPYELDYVDVINNHVNAFKIGSGDIIWAEMLEKVAAYGKPLILATGASTLDEVDEAMEILNNSGCDIALLQCNTNYTASADNYRYTNLNVLKMYKDRYPNVVLGLSDHTFDNAVVVGAVALGARIVERHFTDDNSRVGPDHKFAMNQKTFRSMVDQTRVLEQALGDGVKRVEDNERDTVV